MVILLSEPMMETATVGPMHADSIVSLQDAETELLMLVKNVTKVQRTVTAQMLAEPIVSQQLVVMVLLTVESNATMETPIQMMVAHVVFLIVETVSFKMERSVTKEQPTTTSTLIDAVQAVVSHFVVTE